MSHKVPERQKVACWLYERLSDSVLSAYASTGTLYRGRSQFQTIEIHHSSEFGKMLFLDHELQSTTGDEFIYHETLVHPALVCHPRPRRVAILGGGEGATLREVLRHPCVEWAAMVDIDADVVKVCRHRAPEYAAGAFEDQRAELVIGDARQWLENNDSQLDAVISDLTEPKVSELSDSLFSTEFFALVKRRLGPDGVFSLQASTGVAGALDRHLAIREAVGQVFPSLSSMLCYIPSFACMWAFAVAAETLDPRRMSPEEVDRRLAQRGVEGLRFYDGRSHQRLFNLPRYLREQLAS